MPFHKTREQKILFLASTSVTGRTCYAVLLGLLPLLPFLLSSSSPNPLLLSSYALPNPSNGVSSPSQGRDRFIGIRAGQRHASTFPVSPRIRSTANNVNRVKIDLQGDPRSLDPVPNRIEAPWRDPARLPPPDPDPPDLRRIRPNNCQDLGDLEARLNQKIRTLEKKIEFLMAHVLGQPLNQSVEKSKESLNGTSYSSQRDLDDDEVDRDRRDLHADRSLNRSKRLSRFNRGSQEADGDQESIEADSIHHRRSTTGAFKIEVRRALEDDYVRDRRDLDSSDDSQPSELVLVATSDELIDDEVTTLTGINSGGPELSSLSGSNP